MLSNCSFLYSGMFCIVNEPTENHSESQTVDLGKRDHLCLISQNDTECAIWTILGYVNGSC